MSEKSSIADTLTREQLVIGLIRKNVQIGVLMTTKGGTHVGIGTEDELVAWVNKTLEKEGALFFFGVYDFEPSKLELSNV